MAKVVGIGPTDPPSQACPTRPALCWALIRGRRSRAQQLTTPGNRLRLAEVRPGRARRRTLHDVHLCECVALARFRWCAEKAPQASSSIQLGDDDASWSTMQAAAFAHPVGGGRQPLHRPDNGGIQFGSWKGEYQSTASASFRGGAVASRSAEGVRHARYGCAAGAITCRGGRLHPPLKLCCLQKSKHRPAQS